MSHYIISCWIHSSSSWCKYIGFFLLNTYHIKRLEHIAYYYATSCSDDYLERS
jgi:hypothetical protein